jgi:hypothetical protein
MQISENHSNMNDQNYEKTPVFCNDVMQHIIEYMDARNLCLFRRCCRQYNIMALNNIYWVVLFNNLVKKVYIDNNIEANKKSNDYSTTGIYIDNNIDSNKKSNDYSALGVYFHKFRAINKYVSILRDGNYRLYNFKYVIDDLPTYIDIHNKNSIICNITKISTVSTFINYIDRLIDDDLWFKFYKKYTHANIDISNKTIIINKIYGFMILQTVILIITMIILSEYYLYLRIEQILIYVVLYYNVVITNICTKMDDEYNHAEAFGGLIWISVWVILLINIIIACINLYFSIKCAIIIICSIIIITIIEKYAYRTKKYRKKIYTLFKYCFIFTNIYLLLNLIYLSYTRICISTKHKDMSTEINANCKIFENNIGNNAFIGMMPSTDKQRIKYEWLSAESDIDFKLIKAVTFNTCNIPKLPAQKDKIIYNYIQNQAALIYDNPIGVYYYYIHNIRTINSTIHINLKREKMESGTKLGKRWLDANKNKHIMMDVDITIHCRKKTKIYDNSMKDENENTNQYTGHIVPYANKLDTIFYLDCDKCGSLCYR